MDDLVRAVQAVHGGQSVLAPQAAAWVQRQLDAPRQSARPFPELTDREHDMLAEIVRGRSTVQIARTLGLSEKTVRNYTATMLAKLHARDRAQLIVQAREAGYPDP